jgi:hypothetical protein
MRKILARWSRTSMLFALTLVTIAATAVTAPAASAAACAQPARAQFAYNGGVYFSGYEGDGRFGVQTVTIFRLGKALTVGVVGIQPETSAHFSIARFHPDNIVQEFDAGKAEDNCVLNEWFFATDTNVLSGVQHWIYASYVSGNTGRAVNETVASYIAP